MRFRRISFAEIFWQQLIILFVLDIFKLGIQTNLLSSSLKKPV